MPSRSFFAAVEGEGEADVQDGLAPAGGFRVLAGETGHELADPGELGQGGLRGALGGCRRAGAGRRRRWRNSRADSNWRVLQAICRCVPSLNSTRRSPALTVPIAGPDGGRLGLDGPVQDADRRHHVLGDHPLEAGHRLGQPAPGDLLVQRGEVAAGPLDVAGVVGGGFAPPGQVLADGGAQRGDGGLLVLGGGFLPGGELCGQVPSQPGHLVGGRGHAAGWRRPWRGSHGPGRRPARAVLFPRKVAGQRDRPGFRSSSTRVLGRPCRPGRRAAPGLFRRVALVAQVLQVDVAGPGRG